MQYEWSITCCLIDKMMDTSSQIKVFCEEGLDNDEDLHDGVPLQYLSNSTFTPGQYIPLDNCKFDEKYAPERDFQVPTHETKSASHYQEGYLSHYGSADKLINCDTTLSSRDDPTGCSGETVSGFRLMVSLYFIETCFLYKLGIEIKQ